VIEAIHIPLDVVKHLDLRRGREQGRVYRIAPSGFTPPPPPRLSRATTPELVATLDSPNSWSRDTAHRLIFERQDTTATAALRRLLSRGSTPVARVLALWSLDGLKTLSNDDIVNSLKDQSSRVVEQGVRLAEARLEASAVLLEPVVALAGSDDPRVRFSVALTLGVSKDPRAVAALAAIARRDVHDRWTRLAVLASSNETADQLLAELATAPAFAAAREGPAFLESLAGIVGARNRPNEVGFVRDAVAASEPSLARRLVLGMGRGLSQVGGRLDPEVEVVARFVVRAEAEARDEAAAEATRIEAVAFLACLPYARVSRVLDDLLEPQCPGAVQVAAL
jgi:hypothetical protein